MLAGELLAKQRLDYKANRRQNPCAAGRTGPGALLEEMGLSARAGHYPHQLSGGTAAAGGHCPGAGTAPGYPRFDEPTSAPDPELTGEVLRVLRKLADRKTTIGSPLPLRDALCLDVAYRIMFMDGGVVVEQGPARGAESSTRRRNAPAAFWPIMRRNIPVPLPGTAAPGRGILRLRILSSFQGESLSKLVEKICLQNDVVLVYNTTQVFHYHTIKRSAWRCFFHDKQTKRGGSMTKDMTQGSPLS